MGGRGARFCEVGAPLEYELYCRGRSLSYGTTSATFQTGNWLTSTEKVVLVTLSTGTCSVSRKFSLFKSCLSRYLILLRQSLTHPRNPLRKSLINACGRLEDNYGARKANIKTALYKKSEYKICICVLPHCVAKLSQNSHSRGQNHMRIHVLGISRGFFLFPSLYSLHTEINNFSSSSSSRLICCYFSRTELGGSRFQHLAQSEEPRPGASTI